MSTNVPEPTVNLTLDFLAPAKLGDWVEGTAEFLRAGKTLFFAQGGWNSMLARERHLQGDRTNGYDPAAGKIVRRHLI